MLLVCLCVCAMVLQKEVDEKAHARDVSMCKAICNVADTLCGAMQCNAHNNYVRMLNRKESTKRSLQICTVECACAAKWQHTKQRPNIDPVRCGARGKMHGQRLAQPV